MQLEQQHAPANALFLPEVTALDWHNRNWGDIMELARYGATSISQNSGRNFLIGQFFMIMTHPSTQTPSVCIEA